MEEMMFEKVLRLIRRTFFKGAGTAVAATALLGQNTLSACAAGSSSQEALQSSDIFRVANGKLVEHWDIIQEEVPIDKTLAGNPIFTGPQANK
jgi:hypothetical protein